MVLEVHTSNTHQVRQVMNRTHVNCMITQLFRKIQSFWEKFFLYYSEKKVLLKNIFKKHSLQPLRQKESLIFFFGQTNNGLEILKGTSNQALQFKGFLHNDAISAKWGFPEICIPRIRTFGSNFDSKGFNRQYIGTIVFGSSKQNGYNHHSST